MFISESNFLEATLCLLVILILLYRLSITSNYTKILVASALTIIIFMFASLSILSIMFVLILSLILLDFTILPDLFESGWNSFSSVSSQQALTKRLEETNRPVSEPVREKSSLLTPQTESPPISKIPLVLGDRQQLESVMKDPQAQVKLCGKDVPKNNRILVTFADDQEPPVLEAIKASGVPCPKTEDGLPVHFKFNNSVLFVDKDTPGRKSNASDPSLWSMMTSSLMRFFSALISETAIKLTLTNEAMGGREQVESLVEELQTQVKLRLGTIEKIRETMEKVKENEAEVSKNEDIEFYVTVKRPVQVDISNTGHYILNCQQCHVTCLYPCNVPNDDGKMKCDAMGQDGYCTVCPGKCFWNVHFSQKFKWEYQEFTEKQTVKILKGNIDEDTEETGKWLIEGLEAEQDEVQKQMVKAIKISAQSLKKLKDMLKNPNPLSIHEYIDMLIEGERQEGKPGWIQRVDCLMKVKENEKFKA